MTRLAALIVLAAFPAVAQDGASCAGIENDIARLACFDAAFGASSASVVGDWAITTEVDPLTDYVNTFLTAKGSPACLAGAPELVIRCTTQGLAAFVAQDCPLLADRFGMATVDLRIGDGGAETTDLQVDTSQTAVGYFGGMEARDLVGRIMAANRVAIGYAPNLRPPMTVAFDTAGLQEAIAASGMACNAVAITPILD
jgi:hypothetical protein